ncbi:hypothetical protein F2P81_025821 [Scophthalmus maximus]|uniref:PiggyBac transposable element-derived protein domain-containing protein n=1 Tax=Scophthalmus maximus TaxID=52904 RepID=A0A6A4RHH1_SCOMX|nr:hypothetical protein F2P81_025821 [Scophthalmus maximus]
MVGTVRRNKPELPAALVSKTDRARFSSKFAFTETHALVSYHPKKPKIVLLMSTLHRDAAVSNRDDKRPKIIDYNHNKGGVDNLDKVLPRTPAAARLVMENQKFCSTSAAAPSRLAAPHGPRQRDIKIIKNVPKF